MNEKETSFPDLAGSSTDSIEVAEQPVAQPTLLTEQLQLRPFHMDDASQVQHLLQCREIAANTRTIDHPYPEGAAAIWIATHPESWNTGGAAVFAICDRNDEATIVGAIGLELDHTNEHAEMGYWIGEPYWGKGICTEAAKEILRFGFQHFGLRRIHAHCLSCNPASGRVLEKAGFQHEGMLRQHMKKWGVFEDIEFYGILSEEIV